MMRFYGLSYNDKCAGWVDKIKDGNYSLGAHNLGEDTHMAALKAINAALSFLLELCMLAAFAYWGFQNESPILKIILGIGVPVAIIAFWAIFMAPRSERRVAPTLRLMLQLIIFGASALVLAIAGQQTLASIFAVFIVINAVLLYVWKQ